MTSDIAYDWNETKLAAECSARLSVGQHGMEEAYAWATEFIAAYHAHAIEEQNYKDRLEAVTKERDEARACCKCRGCKEHGDRNNEQGLFDSFLSSLVNVDRMASEIEDLRRVVRLLENGTIHRIPKTGWWLWPAQGLTKILRRTLAGVLRAGGDEASAVVVERALQLEPSQV